MLGVVSPVEYIVKYTGPGREREECVIPFPVARTRTVTVEGIHANCSCGVPMDMLKPCVHIVACMDNNTPEMWHLRWTREYARCFLAKGCDEETKLMWDTLELCRDGKRAWRGVNVGRYVEKPVGHEEYPQFLFRSNKEMFADALRLREEGKRSKIADMRDLDIPYDEVEVYTSPLKRKMDEQLAQNTEEERTDDPHYQWLMKTVREYAKAAGNNAKTQTWQRQHLLAGLKASQMPNGTQEEGLSFGGGEKEGPGKAKRKKAFYERR